MQATPIAIVLLSLAGIYLALAGTSVTCWHRRPPIESLEGSWFIYRYQPSDNNNATFTCFTTTNTRINDTYGKTVFTYTADGKATTQEFVFSLERFCGETEKYLAQLFKDDQQICSFTAEISEQENEFANTLCDPDDFGMKGLCLSKSDTVPQEIEDRCTEGEGYKAIANTNC